MHLGQLAAMATRNKKDSTGHRNSTLVAVALQDHISRQYSLSPCRPPPASGLQSSSTGNARVCSKSQRKGVNVNGHSGRGQSTAVPEGGVLRANSNSDGRERVYPTYTGRSRNRQKSFAAQKKTSEVEYVLDKARPPLTLAQKMGLVEAPPQLLEEREWSKVKVQSSKRHDSTLPCPICQEEFGLREQVLLSCSHVFHLACLKSFEKFSRSKRCPLCRREDYQTRVIFDGAQHYRRQAATTIQAAWRGYVVHKWYRDLRERLPPNNPVLRKKHFERKLTQLTEQLVQSCEQDTRGAESVMSQADVAMETARNAMRMFDLHSKSLESTLDWEVVQTKAEEHILSDCPVCLVPLCSPLLPKPHPSHSPKSHPSQPPKPHLSQPPKSHCSHPPKPHPSQPPKSHPSHPHRPLAMLSCGHLLHLACIEALERYTEESLHLCPLCRTPYHRKVIQH